MANDRSNGEERERTGKQVTGIFLPFAGITRIRFEGLLQQMQNLSRDLAPLGRLLG